MGYGKTGVTLRSEAVLEVADAMVHLNPAIVEARDFTGSRLADVRRAFAGVQGLGKVALTYFATNLGVGRSSCGLAADQIRGALRLWGPRAQAQHPACSAVSHNCVSQQPPRRPSLSATMSMLCGWVNAEATPLKTLLPPQRRQRLYKLCGVAPASPWIGDIIDAAPTQAAPASRTGSMNLFGMTHMSMLTLTVVLSVLAIWAPAQFAAARPSAGSSAPVAGHSWC